MKAKKMTALLAVLLLFQMIPTVFAAAADYCLNPVHTFDNTGVRNYIRTLNPKPSVTVNFRIFSEYFTGTIMPEFQANRAALQSQAAAESEALLQRYGVTGYNELNAAGQTELDDIIHAFNTQLSALLSGFSADRDAETLFDGALAVDASLEILYPDFCSFVQEDLYDSSGQLNSAEADFFAQMIAEAINEALIEKELEDLAFFEASMTEDSAFSLWMSDGAYFEIAGNGQDAASLGDGFLYQFCTQNTIPALTPIEPANPDDSTDSDDYVETDGSMGIDYSAEDIIVPGTKNGFSINLTQETLTLPEEYEPMYFSIDGGKRWRAVGDKLSEEKFPKLFQKDLVLMLSDLPPEQETKYPPTDAEVIGFPTILKRPKAPKVYINYEIAADPTGKTAGAWVLTEKDGTIALKEGIQVGLGDVDEKYREVNIDGYGHFFPGETNGIDIVPVTGQKTTYFIRTAPTANNGSYTAAGKPKKIRAIGRLKKTNYKVKVKKAKVNGDEEISSAVATLKIKKGTYVKMDGVVTLYTESTILDVLDYEGEIRIWTAEKVKKPAGEQQIIYWFYNREMHTLPNVREDDGILSDFDMPE